MNNTLMQFAVISCLLVAVIGCGNRGRNGLTDPRVEVESMGLIMAPVSEDLDGQFDSVINAIRPNEERPEPGVLVRFWVYHGQIIQIESVSTISCNPIPDLDFKSIDRISYGTGPTEIPGYAPAMKNGVVVRPGRESRIVDPGLLITDSSEISAVVECLRSKSTRTTKVLARRGLQLSGGKVVDKVISEECEERTWSGNPGFRIYQKGGAGFILVQGLLTRGEFSGFSNSCIRAVMFDIATSHGVSPESVFKGF